MGFELRYRPSGPHWTAGELLAAHDALSSLERPGWPRPPNDVLGALWQDWYADMEATFGPGVRLIDLYRDTRRAAP